MRTLKEWGLWLLIALAGAAAFGTLALHRGESINAIWLITAAVSCYLIAYRFYSRFIANKVLELNGQRLTPAARHNDGLDYVPTNKWVLFGHHFAAIAGAGPLVGPVLAAQMGYLPGTLWILVGVMFAGAVQDFIVLFISTRRDGKSLGEIIKAELGPVGGVIASIGILMIMVILLAVLALVVVKALVGSPWGSFTIAATIPLAVFMGVYMRYIRPGKIAEISLIGFVLLMLAIVYGEDVAQSSFASWFTLDGKALAWSLIIYGFIASVLPVWLLLAPRDYLSTFLKIGTIVGLALGIIVVAPDMQMPSVTRFIDGSGPVFAGNLFPFLFITIACGAISGFHSLVSSGTTPKMLENETHARAIGYGAMLMESFVAMMALIAACVLEPGVYFAMNSPAALIGTTPQEAAAAISQWGFVVTPEMLSQMAKDVGEQTILSRTGGAPTLAVGMAHILSQVFGGPGMMAFWYHFAILFEALFILTTIDAGTRVCRFMIQDLLGTFFKPLGNTDSLPANLLATTLAVSGWGYFLYQGVIDPLGGINTLWPLFGIANQMLAGMALILCTTVLIKMKKLRFAWITALPCVWVLTTTLYAGWLKIFSENPKIGFLAHAEKFNQAAASGTVLAPAKTLEQMQQVIFNDYVNSALSALFISVVLAMLFFGVRASLQAMRLPHPSAKETPAQFQHDAS
ncbi:carbon starvation CstA family protein [Plesiomonas shigelloides]|uniref:carbon starvation CstA family protein n=1 Tax=Plesiomonas shigelloides TaxID=703 RepID=UPI000E0822B0|nr:carbon starvation CstA family protein [Plesiomonas shigelloides]MDO4688889.1 carbon starvation CstA family protein [Plesiomonas sp.]KAB7698784.1 carbon starvation protein A [Plesiomonas shigelloides]KAB7703944.1 carbon starvation protein A [Plesiomonas shigelloides]MCQ8859600.1 carbon starvation protein A [Plesiomonas shigelloides]QIY09384.1 carbon starvation protein A [Plesiomonas shigelloides]